MKLALARPEKLLGARLRLERERVGLTRDAFAEQAGAGLSTVASWEAGSTKTPAAALAPLVQAGGDVVYVITGVRSAPIDESDEGNGELTEARAAEIDQAFMRVKRRKLSRRSVLHSDREVRLYTIRLYGAAGIDLARERIAERFGAERTPSRSALGRFYGSLGTLIWPDGAFRPGADA